MECNQQQHSSSSSGISDNKSKEDVLKFKNCCNKEFESGKAHAHSVNKQTSLISDNNNNVSCSLCSKEFPSLRSLFGHMRCHPPSAYNSHHMPKWPVKSGLDDDDEEEEIRLRNCVRGLLLLKHVVDASDSWALSTLGVVDEAEVTNDDASWTINNREHEFHEQQLNDYPSVPVLTNMGIHQGAMNTQLVLGTSVDEINDEKDNMVMGNTKMNMGLNQDKPPSVGTWELPTHKYKCSTCDKTFSTHQALGGHRSSHNKFKVTVINGNGDTSTTNHSPSVSAFAQPHPQVNTVLMSQECATKRNSTEEVSGSSKADQISSTIHQCSVCNKIFGSGQALGGHKRCHWTAPAAETQLVVKSSGEEASTTQAGGKRIRLMGFDLNVPASMVDDAAAQDGGAGW